MNRTFSFFLLTLTMLTLFASSISAQWEGWLFRRAVTINSDSTLTDYQVKISLADLTPPFNFNNAEPDGSDLRVAASDETTEIPYWIETWNPGAGEADIWVKVPNIAAGNSTVIYLYYGNPSASAKSNGLTTFRFFDDFETWNYNSGWQDRDTLLMRIADQTVAVYHDSVFYMIGGYGANDTTEIDKNYEYNPAATTNRWTEKAPMPTARWGMLAIEFNGKIYVFGGGASDKNEVYDPVTNTWDTSKRPVGIGLGDHGLMGVKVGDKIHLFINRYHYIYDPATDTYDRQPDLPNTSWWRKWGTCALIGNKIYIIGGYVGGGIPNTINLIYNLTDSTWSTGAPIPKALYGTTRENPVINGKIYVTHGKDASAFYLTNYEYNPLTDTWTSKGLPKYKRDGVGCAVIKNKLYVVGGRDLINNPKGVQYHEVYDPATDTYVANSGEELWFHDFPNHAFADSTAKYKGKLGLLIWTPPGEFRYSLARIFFTNPFALDFDWFPVEDSTTIEFNHRAYVDPAEASNNGSLWFQNVSGIPRTRWRVGNDVEGNYNNLHSNLNWNEWYNMTILYDPPSNVHAVLNGDDIQTQSGSLTGGYRIRFGSQYSGKTYVDNVRIRKWTGTDPVTIVGEEINNPLPVELTSFTAVVKDNAVKLSWRTETEVQNYGFDIERSEQYPKSKIQNLTFEKIGFVEGHGNSNSPKDYSFTDENVISGMYSYRLKQIDTDGSFAYSPVVEVNVGAPKKFELAQNYPNPFNPSTKIVVSIPVKTNLKLMVYNILGELVSTITNAEYEAGTYEFNFDASSLTSGIYMYRVESPQFTAVKKMLLVR